MGLTFAPCLRANRLDTVQPGPTTARGQPTHQKVQLGTRCDAPLAPSSKVPCQCKHYLNSHFSLPASGCSTLKPPPSRPATKARHTPAAQTPWSAQAPP
eukprot:4554530-Amphidinium_carterae.2